MASSYREPEYYLNIATRMELDGVKFVLSHFETAYENYVGGDDGFTGPGYFWTAFSSHSGQNFRVKRVTMPKAEPEFIWESPERVPVTDAKDLTHRNVKHAFRALIDDIMDEQVQAMVDGPKSGPFTALNLTVLFDPRFGS